MCLFKSIDPGGLSIYPIVKLSRIFSHRKSDFCKNLFRTSPCSSLSEWNLPCRCFFFFLNSPNIWKSHELCHPIEVKMRLENKIPIIVIPSIPSILAWNLFYFILQLKNYCILKFDALFGIILFIAHFPKLQRLGEVRFSSIHNLK